MDISTGVPADYATASAATHGFLQPDPLAEALCEGARPPAWFASVDPMLHELATSLLVIRPAATPAPAGCLHAAATISWEGQASLVDPPPSSAVAPGDDSEVWPPRFEPAKHMASTSTLTQDGHSNPSTPTKDGQLDCQASSNPSDVTPTPREAARRLAQFTEEVQIK